MCRHIKRLHTRLVKSAIAKCVVTQAAGKRLPCYRKSQLRNDVNHNNFRQLKQEITKMKEAKDSLESLYKSVD